MATVLAPRHGILLNPSPTAPPAPLPFPTPSFHQSPFAALSASWSALHDSSDSDHSQSGSHFTARQRHYTSSGSATSTPFGSPRQQARKIRFAPLPDPRRAVCITDDGEELPLPCDDDDDDDFPLSATAFPSSETARAYVRDDSPTSATGTWEVVPAHAKSDPGGPGNAAIAHTSSSPGSTPSPSTAAAAATSYVDYTPTTTPALAHPPSPFLKKTKKLFKLSSKGMPDLKLNVSTEDVLTLGTLGLFRAGSRDSSRGGGGSGSRASSKDRGAEGDDEWGTPLDRTTSDIAGRRATKPRGGDGVVFRRTQSYEPADHPRRPASAPVVTKKMQGTRMLNGRVYGSKRNQNLFATARDDPEFVEWGYGGMGSVKAAKESSGSMLWAPLQQSNRVAVGSGGGAAEEDDGSGMGWVKRRKEERQRRERERLEQEAKDRAAARAAARNPAPAPDAGADAGPTAAPGEGAHTHTAHAERNATPLPGDVAEHVHTTVLARPRQQFPHQHAHVHAQHSAAAAQAATETETETEDSPLATPSDSAAGSSSEDEADEEKKIDGEGEKDEDDKDEEEDEGVRKTALGAGVEKISRHKD